MDVQLKELIDKIKSEGVQEAEGAARQIRENAERQAAEIVEKAKQDADSMLSRAKQDISQMEKASKDALKQAGRDLILSVKATLTKIFNEVIKNSTAAAYNESILKDAIPALISEWGKKTSGNITVLLSDKAQKDLEKTILGKLSEDLKKGMTIKTHPGIKTGFRISEKGGDVYYDFTDEGIAESLIQHMNPMLAEIIQKAAGE